jgi:hypothetical protein
LLVRYVFVLRYAILVRCVLLVPRSLPNSDDGAGEKPIHEGLEL